MDVRIPATFVPQPLKPGQPAKQRATCGHCGRSWDDGVSTGRTPTPSGRCPFEDFHDYRVPRTRKKHRETVPSRDELHAAALLILGTGSKDPDALRLAELAAAYVEKEREESRKSPDMRAVERGYQTLTMVAFSDDDFILAERMARRLGFTQTAYTTTSALWGLFCLPDRPTQRKGCIVKSRELGLLYVQDAEDLNMTSGD